MASKLRTLSSVAPELASWLILNNTALKFSPKDTQRISHKDPNTSAVITRIINSLRGVIAPLAPLAFIK